MVTKWGKSCETFCILHQITGFSYQTFTKSYSEVYLEPSRTSMMELFCENS